MLGADRAKRASIGLAVRANQPCVTLGRGVTSSWEDGTWALTALLQYTPGIGHEAAGAGFRPSSTRHRNLESARCRYQGAPGAPEDIVREATVGACHLRLEIAFELN
jgi:hypothetical protein